MKDWREARESDRLRKRVEEIKIAGRPPAPRQRVSTKALAVEEEEEAEEREADEARNDARRAPTVIKFHENESVAPPPAKKKVHRAKNRHGQDHLQAPSALAAR